jgi:FAD/FMN-containing dehydrogenase
MGINTRRGLLIAAGAGAGALGTRHLFTESTIQGEAWPPAIKSDTPVLDDASELSATPVAEHLTLRGKPDKALHDELRAKIKQASGQGVPLVASTARHSMGAQSLAKKGIAISLEQQHLEADKASSTFRVAAGMRWRDVIQRLDEIGFSPAVMQSNNDFGVASTFCVNAHGWPVPYSGFGSTVKSLRLLTASGELLNCSRTENQELFAMSMGGYGLTGLITELDVAMVPNARLNASFEVMPGAELGNRFAQLLAEDSDVQMAYGRLDISLDDFFSEALLISYRTDENQSDVPAATGSGWFSHFSRHIFRAQLDSDRVKSARWAMEKDLAPRINNESVTRNSLINEPVVTLDDKDPARTDILHEYFIEPSRFAEFVVACQEVIPTSYQDLLNITLRYVAPDKESALSYAPVPRIAAVMLFSQEKSRRGEQDMARMTRELIERTLAIGGSYYLPYRLHATTDQFDRCYPNAAKFAKYKREVDSKLVYRHALWDQYLAKY